jgi:hypothetical protein
MVVSLLAGGCLAYFAVDQSREVQILAWFAWAVSILFLAKLLNLIQWRWRNVVVIAAFAVTVVLARPLWLRIFAV